VMLDRRSRTWKGTIIFVDRDLHIGEELVRELEGRGYRTLTAPDDRAAARLATLSRADAVVVCPMSEEPRQSVSASTISSAVRWIVLVDQHPSGRPRDEGIDLRDLTDTVVLDGASRAATAIAHILESAAPRRAIVVSSKRT
jgi:hypothetical protein